MSAFPHEKESIALDQASCRAIDLIHEFAECDPYDTTEGNPWRDPKQMYEQLDIARLQVLEAAQALKQAVANTTPPPTTATSSSSSNPSSSSPLYDEEYLRVQFMDMITDAFADVLNNMKENQEDVDVDILADCLQSGMDILSQDDREFFLALQQEEDLDRMTEEDMDTTTTTTTTTTMTPHEARRQDLGFVQTTVA